MSGRWGGRGSPHIGTIVGRHCWRLCASKFGVQRMFDLLDKHTKQHPKEIGL